MSLTALTADMYQQVFSMLGVEVSYTPSGWIPPGVQSVPIACLAIPMGRLAGMPGGYESTVGDSRMSWRVRRLDIPTPRRGDLLDYGGRQYVIDGAEPFGPDDGLLILWVR